MFKLSEAELDIMLILWECPTAIRPSELLIRLNENGHSWTISTLQTLLSRLLQKGAVTVICPKRFRYYKPALTREAFLTDATKCLLERLRTYSPLFPIKTLVEEAFTAEERATLKDLINER